MLRVFDGQNKKQNSLFCNVAEEGVITAVDVPSVYLIPGELEKQSFDKLLEKKLHLHVKTGYFFIME